MADNPGLEAELEEEAYTRLCDEVSLHVRLGRLSLAEAAVGKLLERWPDRTTAQERAGDLALAQGKVAVARQFYHRALELEPANADAERKYGLALVTLSADERRRDLIAAVVADPTAHRHSTRKPLNALLNALLFPGLGQLYNREHEKGLGLLAGGALLLMLLFYRLIQLPYTDMARASSSERLSFSEQWAGLQVALAQMGPGYWLLNSLLIILYLALYAFSLYDTWKQAQSQQEHDLGVH